MSSVFIIHDDYILTAYIISFCMKIYVLYNFYKQLKTEC